MKTKTAVKALLGTGLLVGGAALAARAWWRTRLINSPQRSLGRVRKEGVALVPDALFQATNVTFTKENTLCWCNDAAVFDALAEAVDAAVHSVHVDIYIWKPGKVGRALAERVAARARAGVVCRLLVDPLGSPGFDEELAPMLREAGCKIHFFRHPKRRPGSLLGRNHRKLVVIDGRVGFTGGFGIADEWLEWREANVRIEGPIVRQMQQRFAVHWLELGGGVLPHEEFERSEANGKCEGGFISSMDVAGLSHAVWVTHVGIAAAQKRLWIANAYFVPPPELLEALVHQARAGVDVRLLLPAGKHNDHAWVSFLQHSTYPTLMRAGVRIYEYQPSMLHAKTMLVDDELVMVGSVNLDPLSQDVLEECTAVVRSKTFAAELEARWERDLSVSRQMQAPGTGPLSLLGGFAAVGRAS